jgi:hypothetical protein
MDGKGVTGQAYELFRYFNSVCKHAKCIFDRLSRRLPSVNCHMFAYLLDVADNF